jgi:hypothetical protein
MNKSTIDAAIIAHRSWVVRFRTAHAGNNTEVFDFTKVKDTGECDLGRWLLTGPTLALLGEVAHAEVVALHKLFHDMAGSIADLLKRYDSRASVALLLIEFDNLSKQLVHRHIQAKMNI